MISGFDHVTLAVPELTPAVDAYTMLLGRPPVWRGSHPSLGTEAALFGLENALIELTAPRPDALEAEGLRAHIAAKGAGFLALSLACEDADACHAALRSRGVRVAPPAHDEAVFADGSKRSYTALELSPRASRGLPLVVVARPDMATLRDAQDLTPSQANALDHVVIRSADLDAAQAFYGAGLGLRLALDTRVGDVRMLFFRVGGVTIEIIEDASVGAQDMFYGAAYRVRDLAACHGRLVASGLMPGEMRAGRKPATQVFSVRLPTLASSVLVLSDPARA